MVMYPSGGIHQPRGVLIGCYNRGLLGEAFAAKPIAEQVAAARAAIAAIHPGQDRDLISAAVVNWNKVPFSLGPWAYVGAQREGHLDNPALRLLNAQPGPVYLAGAYLTQLPGWQEGAVASAQDVVERIARGGQR
jgi:monoamine oxidase